MYGTWNARKSFVIFKGAAKVSQKMCSPAYDKEE